MTQIKEKYDGIVTDLPYGTASKVSEPPKKLMKSFVSKIPKKAKFAIMCKKGLHDGIKLNLTKKYEIYRHKSLTRIGIGSGPLHVVGEFRWSGLAVGDPVRVADSMLWIGATPLANLASRSVWAPPAVPHWSTASLRRGLDAVNEVWTGDLIAEGLAVVGAGHAPDDASALVRAAMPGLAALELILAGSDSDADRESGLASLIGLGPGLTPSGDDLIGGALIALPALGLIECRDALWEHCRALLDGTNDISRIHLRAAALGYGAAALHAAIHATMSGEAASAGCRQPWPD